MCGVFSPTFVSFCSQNWVKIHNSYEVYRRGWKRPHSYMKESSLIGNKLHYICMQVSRRLLHIDQEPILAFREGLKLMETPVIRRYAYRMR